MIRLFLQEIINSDRSTLKFRYPKNETTNRWLEESRKPERFPAVDGIHVKNEKSDTRARIACERRSGTLGLESWWNASKRPWNKKNRKGEPCYAYQAPTNYWLRHFSFFSLFHSARTRDCTHGAPRMEIPREMVTPVLPISAQG